MLLRIIETVSQVEKYNIIGLNTVDNSFLSEARGFNLNIDYHYALILKMRLPTTWPLLSTVYVTHRQHLRHEMYFKVTEESVTVLDE